MIAVIRSFVTALVLGALALVAAPAVAQKDPAKIRLTPQSEEGAVLLRAETIPADSLIRFNKAGKSGFGSRVFVIQIPPGNGQPVYLARTLSPGRYRVDSLWQQNRWGILLRADTVEFEVKPGKISYLGKLNSRELLTRLQNDAVQAGKTVSRGLSGFISDKHGVAVTFSGRDERGLADARRFASETMKAGGDMVELGTLFESHEIK